MDETECRRRVASARVGRLGTTGEDGRPHLVPFTFVLAEEALFTAVDRKPKTTRDLKRLRNIEHDPRVCVLVDHYDDDWSRLWWVRIDARAEIAEDHPEAVRLLSEKYAQYRDDPPPGPVIVIRPQRWRGWSAE